VESYLDSRDINGKLSEVFSHTIGFFNANLRHNQANKGVNTTGENIPLQRENRNNQPRAQGEVSVLTQTIPIGVDKY